MASIVPLSDIASSAKAGLVDDAAQIFFETSNTRNFETPQTKDAFRARWFGHYLEAQPEAFFLALDGGGAAIGYLAGCLDSFADRARGIVEDISYYTPAFFARVREHPSHFHINVKPGRQGRGVGRILTARFIQECAKAGSPGVHVVTGAGSPAASFYEACGFGRIAIPEASPALAVLGRATPAP